MARDGTGETGVTNHVGEVFTGQGSETHKGLIVTDGSIIPCALGINPLATITALAERSVAVYAEREGLHINTTKNKILDLFGEPQYPVGKQPNMPQDPDGPLDGGNHDLDDACDENLSLNKAGDIIRNAAATQAPGFGFAEVMSGFLHKDSAMTHDSQETYELAYRTAKNLCESARFFLSVQAFNTRSIIYDPDHSAMLTGTFVCPTIPGSPFMVQRGDFNLFLMDHKAPGTRNLTYDFHMRGIDGRRLHFHGYKVVDSSVALAPVQFWRSTTTLYVTVSEVPDHDHKPVCAPHDDPEAWRRGRVVAKGMMHVSLADFASQILTMTPTGSNLFRKAWSAVSFLTYFTRKAAGLFLAPLMPLQYPSKSYSGYINDTPPSGSYVLVAADKVRTRMHMWEPTHIPAGQEAKNVLFIPGASVDHQIYATPTIPYNAVNYFCRAGYRVFCVTHRIGQLIVAQNDWTTYDARLDIHAALAYIRAHYGEEPIYTVAHCMGSVAFSCGLLDGTIPASWIRGITASQVFMNPIWNLQNMVKVFVGPIPMDKMYKLVAGNWYSCTTGPDDSLVQRAINELLRLYPNERKELCTSASCHRVSLVYGRCWSHANLNEATHRQIDRFFGGVNMTCLHLLMRMGKYGAVMKNAKDNFEELPTAENVQRLKGIPIFLFVGRENAVLTPASTEKTYEVLTDTFGNNYGECAISPGGSRKNCDGVMYTRRIVPGYGHLDPWIGRNAWRDVYPMVREEMDRIVRGDDYKFVEPNDKFKRMVDEGKLW